MKCGLQYTWFESNLQGENVALFKSLEVSFRFVEPSKQTLIWLVATK